MCGRDWSSDVCSSDLGGHLGSSLLGRTIMIVGIISIAAQAVYTQCHSDITVQVMIYIPPDTNLSKWLPPYQASSHLTGPRPTLLSLLLPYWVSSHLTEPHPTLPRLLPPYRASFHITGPPPTLLSLPSYLTFHLTECSTSLGLPCYGAHLTGPPTSPYWTSHLTLLDLPPHLTGPPTSPYWTSCLTLLDLPPHLTGPSTSP